MMPVIDVLIMTQTIQKLSQNSIIIAIYASVLEVERQRMALGCQDFIVKPFLAEELFNEIKIHLGLSYIYEPTCQKSTQKLGDKRYFKAIVTNEMAIPPREKLISLHMATLGGDLEVEQIAMDLKQLNPEYSTFTKEVLELANNFRYEELA